MNASDLILPGEQLAVLGNNASGKTQLAHALQTAFGTQLQYVAFKDTYGDAADGKYYLQLRWNRQELDNHAELSGETRSLFSFSSGELRKYSIDRALQRGGRLLVIDNPFIGLDAPSREAFAARLGELVRLNGLQVVLMMARADVMPDFITHVVQVQRPGVWDKMSVDVYRSAAAEWHVPDPDKHRLQAVLDLPHRDLASDGFYPMGGHPEVVRCRDVTIRYDDRTILKHLDWTVHEGESWVVSGCNGSGKSTLLSLVCADNPQAYACHIELFSHRRGSGESIWDIKRHIGYVSPELHRAFQDQVSALQMVAGGLYDTSGFFRQVNAADREACMRWMWIFRIDHLAERPYLRLSDGEQRLCLLARAFVRDPELLVLDEPMHGLDDCNSLMVRMVIDAFMRRPHKTLLFVTHFESELPGCITHRLMLERHA